jgi:hypothetical protein
LDGIYLPGTEKERKRVKAKDSNWKVILTSILLIYIHMFELNINELSKKHFYALHPFHFIHAIFNYFFWPKKALWWRPSHFKPFVKIQSNLFRIIS